MILKSGSFVLNSKSLEVTLDLKYRRSLESDGNDVMGQGKIEDFIQHLGFAHGSDVSSELEVFTSTFRKLASIREVYQQLFGVGYNAFCGLVEFAVAGQEAEIDKMLNVSHEELRRCDDWLKEVRLEYTYSLLYQIDELHYIHQILAEARSIDGLHESRGSAYVVRIAEAMSRINPESSQHPECLELVAGYINATTSADISWLEDGKSCIHLVVAALVVPAHTNIALVLVSRLVDMFGKLCQKFELKCFQAVEPGLHKRIVIHKISCCDDMVFAAPLKLLHRIYKVSMVQLAWILMHSFMLTVSFFLTLRIELQHLLRFLMELASNRPMR